MSLFQPAQLGIGRSIRSGATVPPKVLVADMGDGSLFLQGCETDRVRT